MDTTGSPYPNWIVPAPQQPDDFHYIHKAGATVHSIGWQQMSRIPTRREAWWSIFQAYSWLCAYPSDRYSKETLVVSLTPMIHRIATKVLAKVRSNAWRDSPAGGKDLGGADLFSVGLEAVLEVLESPPEFGPVCDDDPNDPDVLDQFARYVGGAAQKRDVRPSQEAEQGGAVFQR